MTCLLLYICRHFHFHKKEEPLLSHESLPGVSIVKPLMGVDDLLVENLESHFSLNYPKVKPKEFYCVLIKNCVNILFIFFSL